LSAVHFDVVTPRHQTKFFKAYENVYSSKQEAETYYGRFLENGWVSGAWKNRELVGVLTWTPREEAKYGLAEIIDFWVKAEERQKGIGGKLIEHSRRQMKKYFQRFGATLRKIMLITGTADRFSEARSLYEKKGFRVVARIPRNALDNPDQDYLIYVLKV